MGTGANEQDTSVEKFGPKTPIEQSGNKKSKANRLMKLRRENQQLRKELAELKTLYRRLLEQVFNAQTIESEYELPTPFAESKLTARERQVLGYFVRQPNDELIADQLGTKPQTVRNQLASIQRKLGIESREQLLAASYFRIRSESHPHSIGN